MAHGKSLKSIGYKRFGASTRSRAGDAGRP